MRLRSFVERTSVEMVGNGEGRMEIGYRAVGGRLSSWAKKCARSEQASKINGSEGLAAGEELRLELQVQWERF